MRKGIANDFFIAIRFCKTIYRAFALIAVPCSNVRLCNDLLRSRRGTQTFGHGGDVAGYQAAMYINRDKGIGVIVLSNTRNGAIEGDLAIRSLDIVSK